MRNVNDLIGSHDILFMTLDTLRYDVAVQCLEQGRLPNLARLLPDDGWERRHTPGSFTYAAHQAFFAGFLPTPCEPGPHPRLFAASFEGSETTAPETFVYDAPTFIEGLHEVGYRTICIGGVGFFNGQTALGRVLSAAFEESYWTQEMGVTGADSMTRQVQLACRRLRDVDQAQRVLLFINVSAIHQPNRLFSTGAVEDSLETQADALAYVDSCLPPLVESLRQRGDTFCIVCSDHGTAYGEEGRIGHRCAHPVVWNVPYAEFLLPYSGRSPS